MCVFCVAVPATAATGMALDQKARKKSGINKKAFYLRPYVVLTILAIFFLMSASVFFHSRNSG